MVLRAARLAFAAVLVLPLVACGDDEGALPPDDEAGIAAEVQPLFDPFELAFTYGSLDDFPGGKHLALYVEPTGAATDQQYLDRLLDSAAAVAPAVFEEFPGLHSFDICQEPVPTGPDDDPRPKPRTVLILSRRMSDLIDDWSTATLADVMVVSRTGSGGEVSVDDAIAQLPDYVAAKAEADRRSPPGEDDAGY